jgi:uncharacterized protein (DUF427 family)
MSGTRTAVKIPGPDHPITITSNPHRILVMVGDRVIANTQAALTLREASYPAVQYIPIEDVDMLLLERSEHTTYCPYKGECTYYDIPSAGDRSADVAWTYDAPYAAVAAIKGHLAFYSDRVNQIEDRADT